MIRFSCFREAERLGIERAVTAGKLRMDAGYETGLGRKKISAVSTLITATLLSVLHRTQPCRFFRAPHDHSFFSKSERPDETPLDHADSMV